MTPKIPSTQDEPIGREALQRAAVTQAMEWFTRHRAGELNGAQKQAFMEWLRASPLHVGEYLAAARMAEDLPVVAARLRAEQLGLLERVCGKPETNVVEFNSQAISRISSLSRRSMNRWAVAAVLTLLIGGVWFWTFTAPGFIGLPRTIEVAHGEQRTLQLYDGSVVHLNTDTRIKVRYQQDERVIEFERGQALFQVAHDAARPFRVKADGAEVVAVGTQFELYRKARGELTVTVVEGKVDVSRATKEWPAMRLASGEQVELGSVSAQPKAIPVDVRVATAWVQREVVFNQQPLSEVAAEFDRYSSVPVTIESPTLRDLRVSGIFKAYDMDSFVAFLQQFEGVEVERTSRSIRVQLREEEEN